MRTLLLLLLACPLAIGLGIAPANEEFAFENETHIVQYRIYNTELAKFTANIDVNGSLAPYIKLDQYRIEFSPDQRVTLLQATITQPQQGEYTADITVNGMSTVVSRLEAESKGKKEAFTPTGAVVAAEDKNSFLWPGILIAVIVANILFLTVRKSQSPAEALLTKLKRMDDKGFTRHVDKYKNDFADSINKTDPELAFRIYDTTSRKQMLMQVQEYLSRHATQKTPQQLQKEIKELRHELDTFDFSGYEKDL